MNFLATRSIRSVRQVRATQSSLSIWKRSNCGLLAIAALIAASFAIAGPSFGQLQAVYQLEGELYTPLPTGDYQINPLEGTGETPIWSQGFFTTTRLGADVTNRWVVYNGTLLECDSEDPDNPANPEDRICNDLYEGMIPYAPGVGPEVTKNTITIVFENADPNGGAESIGPGTLHVTELDMFNLIESAAGLEAFLKIDGIGDTNLGGGRGTMDETRLVVSWEEDLTGFAHSEIMCVSGGTFCAANAGFDSQELIVAESTSGLGIDLTDEHPFDCIVNTRPCPDGLFAWPSKGMTFSEDFSSVTFESFAQEIYGHRGYYAFRGTLLSLPEPGSALLQVAAVASVVAIRRRRLAA